MTEVETVAETISETLDLNNSYVLWIIIVILLGIVGYLVYTNYFASNSPQEVPVILTPVENTSEEVTKEEPQQQENNVPQPNMTASTASMVRLPSEALA